LTGKSGADRPTEDAAIEGDEIDRFKDHAFDVKAVVAITQKVIWRAITLLFVIFKLADVLNKRDYIIRDMEIFEQSDGGFESVLGQGLNELRSDRQRTEIKDSI